MPNSMQGYKKVLATFKKRRWMQQYKIKWLLFKINIRKKGLKRWVLLKLLPLRKQTAKATFASRMYWLGFFLSVLWFIVLLGVILHLNPATVITVSIICLGGAVGCWAIGFTSEIVILLTTYWQNPIVKIFVSFLGVIAATFSLVASRLLINSFTRVDPSHLPIAVSIFTTLFTPIVVWGLAVVALFLTYVTLISFLLLSFVVPPLLEVIVAVRNSYIYRFFLHKRKVPYDSLFFWKKMNKWIGKLGGVTGTIALVIALTLVANDRLYQYQQQIAQVVTSVIVYSNYRPNSDECKNHNKGEWVAYIGNTGSHKISVAVPNKAGGYTFQTRSCN